MSPVERERWPAQALVEGLLGRRVTEASCDGEGTDDLWLRLDDDTVWRIDVGLENEVWLDGSDVPRARFIVERRSYDEWPANAE